MNETYASNLVCPRCQRELASHAGKALRCESCAIDFPDVEGMPWLFSEPAVEWDAWKARIHAFEYQTAEILRRLAGELARDDLLTTTRARLEKLAADRGENLRAVRSILKGFYPLESKHSPVQIALRSNLSAQQGLQSYATNILRDWAEWGNEENQIAADHVLAAIGDSEPKSVLVLGGGASRLAVDLHDRLPGSHVTVLDINPLLLLFAGKMVAGEEIEMQEFPLNPVGLADASASHRCRKSTVSTASERLRFILGDALNAPFSPGAFDLVLTPWVIDILPEDFAVFSKRVNRLTAPSGRWINFGSLVFHQSDPRLLYSPEEVRELLGLAGFSVSRFERTWIPYLKSPSQAQLRQENVLTFSATKTTDAEIPYPYRRAPSWIDDPSEKVPPLPQLARTVQIGEIIARVAGLIDGKRTLAEVSRAIASHYQMPPEMALEAVKKFLLDEIEKK